MQKDLYEFEKNLSQFTSSKYSIGVANATDGLEISWMALNLRPGDEVICSAHTMLATASAIKFAGGIPIPVEIGNDNLIDPDAIEASITSRTVGIMPTQLNGRTCDMERIMGIANKYKLYVVEDAAQALGSKFKGKNAGTFGNASAISFFQQKFLDALEMEARYFVKMKLFMIEHINYMIMEEIKMVMLNLGAETAGLIIYKQQY